MIIEPELHFFKAPSPHLLKGYHDIAYYQWGDENNKDVVLCVHGLSRNARDFDYLASHLAKDFRVICIDIVGRGKSQWLEFSEIYNYTTYTNDIIELLKHLAIKNVNWVGTSMGGIIGMLVTAQYPQYIKRLILNDIGPLIPGKSLQRIIKYVGTNTSFATLEQAKSALKTKMTTFGINDDMHWDHIFKHSLMQKDGKYHYSYDPKIVDQNMIGVKIDDIDMWPIWKNITCPTMIIRGDKSDVLLAGTYSKMQKSSFVEQAHEFENIGHAPHLMESNQINIIASWLTK
ncbi:alpha/beta hydrolase [Rickettsiales bacterium]|nr:alpha/beta hydrolase [Rickettsiales bacterium]